MCNSAIYPQLQYIKLLSLVSLLALILGLLVRLHLGKDKDFCHYIWENINKIGKSKAIFG